MTNQASSSPWLIYMNWRTEFFTESWSIPYMKDESLGKCLVAAARLAKEGNKNKIRYISYRWIVSNVSHAPYNNLIIHVPYILAYYPNIKPQI